MNHKSCFFIGHREAFDAIYPALLAAVRQHIVDFHVSEFVVGHYGQFDRLAVRAAIAQANRYMLNHSDFLIVYIRHPASNPANLVADAVSRECRGLIYITQS